MSRRTVSLIVGVLGFVIALVAYVPSIVAFTPAIALSFPSALLAIFAWALGARRLAAITAYTVVATIIVSPSFFQLPNLYFWITLTTLLEIVFGLLLYRNYRASA